MPNANTKPPITAVKRVDFLRHQAITIGAANIDTAQLVAPNQPVFGKAAKKRKKNQLWLISWEQELCPNDAAGPCFKYYICLKMRFKIRGFITKAYFSVEEKNSTPIPQMRRKNIIHFSHGHHTISTSYVRKMKHKGLMCTMYILKLEIIPTWISCSQNVFF